MHDFISQFPTHETGLSLQCIVLLQARGRPIGLAPARWSRGQRGSSHTRRTRAHGGLAAGPANSLPRGGIVAGGGARTRGGAHGRPGGLAPAAELQPVEERPHGGVAASEGARATQRMSGAAPTRRPAGELATGGVAPAADSRLAIPTGEEAALG